MTNNQIIFEESIRLMNEGKLRGTGEFVTVTNTDGETRRYEIPETIHTFNGWKAAGFKVRKGEHSNIRITIWKHTTRQLRTDTENAELNAMNAQVNAQGGQSRMFMKVAAFFTSSQVEPIKARA